ncbi:MAG: IS1380 family transposase [Candidatus Accumulibacter sp.]|uniref:IS1380 family transposase n=1 Tax=Candidatus Accumulibacter affinis TaxID=2954384 RepID=A0A935T9L7_9PROT|nr:IS1380 family transposase [Candidatus Accumulibacter affinis]
MAGHRDAQAGQCAGLCGERLVTPLVLMVTGGGRSLEDLRTLKNDTALNQVLKQDVLPSTDAVGDWLRRTGTGTGLDGLDRINRRAVATRIRQIGIQAHTLDGDASQIVAEKEAAHFTYQGEQGYMPMIGHLAEAGVVIHEEFREGNIAPATQNLEFIQACEARLPKGHRIAHVRLDSAGYQADLFNHCEDTGKTFAIGGRLDAPTLQAIAEIPESAWKTYADCAVAETVHSMNDTRKSFRLIVVKYPRQAELFDDSPKYHVITSNRVESAADTLIWYRQRGEVSENGIQELKIGFGMERMPCGQFKANAAFFRIGVLAHNLFVLFKHSALGEGWQRHPSRHRALAPVSPAGQARAACRRLGIEDRQREPRPVPQHPRPHFRLRYRQSQSLVSSSFTAETTPGAARHGAARFVPSD